MQNRGAGLGPLVQLVERSRVRHLEGRRHLLRQLRVRAPQLILAMSIRAILTVLTVATRLKELARLCLVVVVGHAHHFVLHFEG